MKALTEALKSDIRVENMRSNSGNDVPNQFLIYTNYGKMFRSYNSNIAFIPNDEDIIYLGEDWNYSRTTSKYRGYFLGLSTEDLRKMIENKTAVIVKDL